MTLPLPEQLRGQAAALLQAWRVPDTAVEVLYNPRLSTAAGRAFVRMGRIELNPHLLAKVPAQLSEILAHETAHIAAARLFGPRVAAHGRHWRALMRLAGFAPNVTHNIPIDRKRAKPRRLRN